MHKRLEIFMGQSLIVLVGLGGVTSGARAEALWATDVHERMIESAFLEESFECLFQMKAGSRRADASPYQAGEYSYMHAMRKQGQSVEEARDKMWDYIDRKYQEVVLLEQSQRHEDACFIRGMALHPIMDSTSPAHRGFAQWDPLNIADALKHGDFYKYVHKILPLIPDLGEEDMHVIDLHPEFLTETAALMKAVDDLQREIH